MTVICQNKKCKFPFAIDPKQYEWREVPGPLGANGKPKKSWIAALQCPNCQERFDQHRARRP